jgi:ferredoxin--NADP+ reductase
MHPVIILSNQELAKGHYILSFRREFNFLPGQVLSLALDPAEKPRMYSIASGAGEEHVRILYDVVHEGFFTPRLAQLKPGDTLFVSGPKGFFSSTPEPAWWIAAGTGIAPFSSMFFSGMGDNKTIIHAGRFADSFFFEKEFLPVLKENYIRCCSREAGEGLYPGRVTDFLAGLPALPSDQNFYLCGSTEFVVDVRDVLIEKGVSFEKVFAEIYF